MTRTEKQVDLDWANDSDLPFESNTGSSDPYTNKGSTSGQLNGDTSSTSVRYSGKITPTISGEQVFKVRADGAIRLWVNGKKVIDNGEGKPIPGNSIPPTIPEYAKVNLEAGKAYDIKLEYSRRAGYLSTMGGLVGVQMSWASLNAPQDLSA